MFGGDRTVVMVMLVMTNVRVEVVINTHLYAGDSYERLVYYKGLSINKNI